MKQKNEQSINKNFKRTLFWVLAVTPIQSVSANVANNEKNSGQLFLLVMLALFIIVFMLLFVNDLIRRILDTIAYFDALKDGPEPYKMTSAIKYLPPYMNENGDVDGDKLEGYDMLILPFSGPHAFPSFEYAEPSPKTLCVEEFFHKHSKNMSSLRTETVNNYLIRIKCPIYMNNHNKTTECNCDKIGGCWTKETNAISNQIFEELAQLNDATFIKYQKHK